MSDLIFWDVDTQADFMNRDGKLYVPGAEKIIPNLKRLTDWARENDILVVASACAHTKDDEEFKEYPAHCLIGTEGQEKIPETTLTSQLTLPNRPVPLPSALHMYQQVILEKQRYDVFTSPNTEPLLERLGKDCEFVLYGVVTEICVAHAARGLLDRGYRIRVVGDAVRHLDETKGQALLEEVARRGGRLVTTDEVVGSEG